MELMRWKSLRDPSQLHSFIHLSLLHRQSLHHRQLEFIFNVRSEW